MKKRSLSVVLALLITTSVVGCGAKTNENSDVNPNGQLVNETEQEDVVTEESPAETEVPESLDLTFADLSDRQFIFTSGAGGWTEEFVIEADGSFTGNFHDSDMGVTGEGYENGTYYCCSYTGHFTDLTKINDYTYQMKLADIVYDDIVGKEEIIDNTYYIYTDSYCLGRNDTFTIYLPGTPMKEFSEEVRIWLFLMSEEITELPFIAIVDEVNLFGITSTDRYYY